MIKLNKHKEDIIYTKVIDGKVYIKSFIYLGMIVEFDEYIIELKREDDKAYISVFDIWLQNDNEVICSFLLGQILLIRKAKEYYFTALGKQIKFLIVNEVDIR